MDALQVTGDQRSQLVKTDKLWAVTKGTISAIVIGLFCHYNTPDCGDDYHFLIR